MVYFLRQKMEVVIGIIVGFVLICVVKDGLEQKGEMGI